MKNRSKIRYRTFQLRYKKELTDLAKRDMRTAAEKFKIAKKKISAAVRLGSGKMKAGVSPSPLGGSTSILDSARASGRLQP